MLTLLLLAIQVAAGDSLYASPALRRLVSQAADANRLTPGSAASYGAKVESDVAILTRGANGTERMTQLEQVASDLHWRMSSGVEQHIVGYRTTGQPAGNSSVAVSALTILRRPWIVPTLSGNRFRVLLVWRDGSLTPNGRTTLQVVHPLADDRDTYYRFDGADTVRLMLPDGRVVGVVRFRVRPRPDVVTPELLFNGTVDVDLTDRRVVRLRGRFVTTIAKASAVARLVRRGLQTVAWAELVNEPVTGGHWLPMYQRIELQGVSPLAKDFRPVFRIVSRLRSRIIDWDGQVLRSGPIATAQIAEQPVERLVVASRDSLGQFSTWTDQIGVATIAAASTAFMDTDTTAADTSGARGHPVDSAASHKAHAPPRIVRVYAGLAERFRSYAPGGLSVKADAGQVWSDPATRAAVTLQWRRAPWLSAIRAQRTLVRTNGLLPSLGTEPWVLTLNIGHEDGLPVGYGNSALSFTKTLAATGAVLHITTGLASDRPESIGIRLSPANPSLDANPRASSFGVPNLQTAVTLELRPNVRAERPTSGLGGGIAYERRDGDLRWERTVGWLLARYTGSRMTYTSRVDGVSVMNWRSPPQAFLQIAPSEQVPANAYWQSSARRAALLRLSASYRLFDSGSSLQSLHWLYLPTGSPTIGVGMQSEWNDGYIAGTPPRSALAHGTDPMITRVSIDPATGRAPMAPRYAAIRTTVSAIIRPFGGSVGFGIGRAIESGSNWTLSLVTDPWW